MLHFINTACFSYVQSIPAVNDEQRNDFSYIGNLMTKEFIGQQLILIIKSLDTSEEGGRYVLMLSLVLTDSSKFSALKYSLITIWLSVFNLAL